MKLQQANQTASARHGFPMPATAESVLSYLIDADEGQVRDVVFNILRDRVAGLLSDSEAYDLLRLVFTGEGQ